MYRKASSVLRAYVRMGVTIDGVALGSIALQCLYQLYAKRVIIFM